MTRPSSTYLQKKKCFVLWLSVPHATCNFVYPKMILHNRSHVSKHQAKWIRQFFVVMLFIISFWMYCKISSLVLKCNIFLSHLKIFSGIGRRKKSFKFKYRHTTFRWPQIEKVSIGHRVVIRGIWLNAKQDKNNQIKFHSLRV